MTKTGNDETPQEGKPAKERWTPLNVDLHEQLYELFGGYSEYNLHERVAEAWGVNRRTVQKWIYGERDYRKKIAEGGEPGPLRVRYSTMLRALLSRERQNRDLTMRVDELQARVTELEAKLRRNARRDAA